jgi:hypothetical protein
LEEGNRVDIAGKLRAAGRTWRTVKHLTPEQWAYRVRNRGARGAIAASPTRFEAWLDSKAAALPLPEPRMGGAERVLVHQAYLHGPHLEEMRAGHFTFLNRTVDLGEWPTLDWRVDLGEANNPLWRMNLSYFGYLVPMLARGRTEDLQAAAVLVQDFETRCGPGAPGTLRDAWTAFAASFRVIHLLAGWTLYRNAGGPPDPAAEQVLARHIRRCAAYSYYLREAELGFNHMLKNLVALAVYAGCCDRCAPWQEWLAKALPDCVENQFLADGGHVERSPIYQGLSLQDLAIASASWLPAEEKLGPLIVRARAALSGMLHPDGEIGLFNDAWISEAPLPDQLEARPAADGQIVLAETGYGRLAGSGDCVLFDAGPVGPDSNPGHAHADFLSFELSVGGARAVVDAGTPTYTAGPLRNACRSARAHNGPRLEGLEPIEAWASFRVGVRGKAWFLGQGLPDDLAPMWLAGMADGYERAADISVGRWLGFWPGRQLLVVDCWSRPHAGARTDLLLAQPLETQVLTGIEVGQEADEYWPRFGAPEPVQRLSLAPDGNILAFCLCWGKAVPETEAIAARVAEALPPSLAGRQPHMRR